MITKVLCALLILRTGLCWEADAQNYGLEEDIKAGQNSIRKIRNITDNDFTEVFYKWAEVDHYIRKSNEKYLDESKTVYTEMSQKAANITAKYVGEAIDKNKNMNTFKCLLKAANESSLALKNTNANFGKCCLSTLFKALEQLDNMDSQLEMINQIVTAFYKELYHSVSLCKDKDCIAKLVLRAQTRQQNVRKVLMSYNYGDVQVQYGEGIVACIRARQNTYENSLRKCENDMKIC